MFRNNIHESVAEVIAKLGVKTKQQISEANNSDFVKKGFKGVAKGLIKEEDEAKDETNGGNPDGSETKVDAAKPGTKAKADKADTKAVKEEEEKKDEEKCDKDEKCDKEEDKKEDKKDEDKKEDDKEEKKEEDKKDEDKKDEKKEEKTDESEKFYTRLSKPVTFMFFEGVGGKTTVEVHGLTEEELAPFGGKAPLVPAKWEEKAKAGGEVGKGAVGALMVCPALDASSKNEILAGNVLCHCGWKAPVKGTGAKTEIFKKKG